MTIVDAPGRSARFSADAILALDAALLTMIGSSVRGDLGLLLGVPITTAGWFVAWSAAGRRPRPDRDLTRAYTLLAASAAIGVVVPLPHARWWYEVLFRAYPLAGLVAIGVVRGAAAEQRRLAVIALVAAATAVSLLGPTGLPHLTIDLWYWIQTTTTALLHGAQPYTITNIDPSRGAWDYGSTPTVFPYMPAVMLLAAPGVALFGDYRYVLALWLPITVWLFRSAARRLRLDGEFTDAATLALALHPRGLSITITGYTDPFLVAVAAAFLWCVARRWRAAEAVAFMLLPAVKQYVLAPVVLYAALRRRAGPLAVGATVAAATVLPFLVWNLHATLDGILYLLRAPIGFRPDSDSLTALVAALTGWASPRWLGIAAQMMSAVVAGWMLRDRGVGGMLLASSVSLVTCFLFSTQAFVNYYFFAAMLLVFASAALASPAEDL